MKRLSFVAMLVWFELCAPRFAFAQRGAGLAPQDKISIEAKEAQITDLLNALFQANPSAKKVVRGDVRGVVNIKLDDVPWEIALRYVCEVAGLRLRKDPNGVYVIETLMQPTLRLSSPAGKPATVLPSAQRTAPKVALPFLNMSQDVVSLFGPSTLLMETEPELSQRYANDVDLNGLAGRVVASSAGSGAYNRGALVQFNSPMRPFGSIPLRLLPPMPRYSGMPSAWRF